MAFLKIHGRSYATGHLFAAEDYSLHFTSAPLRKSPKAIQPRQALLQIEPFEPFNQNRSKGSFVAGIQIMGGAALIITLPTDATASDRGGTLCARRLQPVGVENDGGNSENGFDRPKIVPPSQLHLPQASSFAIRLCLLYVGGRHRDCACYPGGQPRPKKPNLLWRCELRRIPPRRALPFSFSRVMYGGGAR